MAADENTTELKIDTSQYEAALRRVIALHEQLKSSNAAFDSLATSIDSASGKIKGSIEKQIDATTKLTSKYEQAEGESANFAFSIKTVAPAVDKASEAVTRYAIQLSKLAASPKDVKIPTGADLSGLGRGQVIEVNKLIQEINTGAKGTDLTIKELRQDLNSVLRGSYAGTSPALQALEKIKTITAGLPGAEKFQRDIVQSIASVQNLGAARDDLLKKSSTKFAQNLVDPSVLKSGTAAEIFAVEKAGEAKIKELRRLQEEKVPQADIEKATKQFGLGQFTQISSETRKLIELEAQLQKAVQAVGDTALKTGVIQQTAAEKATAIANKALEQTTAQQKAVAAKAALPAAFADVQKVFGPIPKIADEGQVQKISAGFGGIAQAIAEGKVNLTQLAEQYDIVANKKVVPIDADKAVKELNRDVVSLYTSLQTLADKEQAAADKLAALANAEAIKVAQKSLATQKETTIQAAIPAKFATVKGNIEQVFGAPSDTSISQIQKYNTAYSDMARILASGTVTFSQFIEQIDIVKNKKIVPDSANEDINTLRKLITSLGNEFTILAEKEQIAADKLAAINSARIASRITAEKASIKQEGVQLLAPKITETVQADVSKAFGGLNLAANAADIQRINVAFGEMTHLIANGTITYKQFLTVLDSVKNKQIVPVGFNADLDRLRASLASVASAYTIAEQRGSAYNRVVVSLAGSLHLFTNLLLYSAFSKLTTAFSEGIKSAGEFETKIGLIKTITQDQASSTDAWAASLTKLSNELGKPVIEVAGAAYDTLSNQVTQNKKETEDFLKTAGDFGRTVGATLPEAVNLLSTAIKGLGLNISESEKIAAIFFGGIDYGRITAQGFNATLGRSVAIGRDLKISLEELVAAQAALTQVGFGPEEAGTRLTNLLLGLEKPSAELKKFFESFGAKTGREFTESVGGLQGVVQALSEGSKSGAINIEQLFPELRKLQAAFGLTNDSGKAFSQILKDISNNLEKYKAAQKLTEQTDSFKLAQQYEILTNNFIKLGGELRSVFVTISDAVGGAGTRISELISLLVTAGEVTLAFYTGAALVRQLGPIYAALSSDLLAVSVLYRAAGASAAFFSAASLPVWGGIALATGVAIIALKQYIDSYKQAILDTAAKEIDFKVNINTKSVKESLNKITETIVNEGQQWINAYQQISGKLTIVLTTELDKQKEALKDLGKTVDNIFKSVTDIIGQGIHNLESAARKASDVANDTAKNIQEIQRTSHDKEIEFQRELAKAQHTAAGGEGGGRGEEVIVLNEIIRLQKIAGEHSKEEAIDPTKIGQAKKDIEDAIRLLDSLKSGYIEAASKKHEISFSVSTTTKDTGIKGIIQSQLESIKRLQTGKVIAPPEDQENQFSIANNQNNQLYGNIYSWKQKINELTQQLVDIENKQHDAQLKNSVKLQEIARDNKKALDDAVDAYKKFSEFSLLDKETGKIRTAPLIAGQPQDQAKFIRDELAKAQKLQKDADEKVTKAYNDVLNQPQAGLKTRLDLQEIARKQLEELRKAQLDFGEGKLGVGKIGEKLRLEDVKEKEFGEGIGKAQEKAKALQEASKKTTDSIAESTKEAERLTKALTEGSRLKGFEKLPDLFKKFTLEGPEYSLENAIPLLKQLNDLYDQSKEKQFGPSPLAPFGKGPELRPEAVKIPTDLKTTGVPEGGKEIQTSQAITNLIEAVKNIVFKQPQLQQQKLELGNIQSTLNSLGINLNGIPLALQTTTGAFTEFAGAIKGKTGEINGVLNGFIQAISNATARLNTTTAPQGTATTTPEARAAVPEAFAEPQASGGLIKYYSKGTMFKPKGTDTIPAMLSPNEFVVSQKGTSMFLNQLELMNKGIDPYSVRAPYFASGGSASSQKSTNKLMSSLLDGMNPLKQAPYHSETNILKSIHPTSTNPIISQKGTKKFVNELMSINTENKPPTYLEENLFKALKPDIQPTPVDVKGLIKKINSNVNNPDNDFTLHYSTGGMTKTFMPQMYSPTRASTTKYYNQGGSVSNSNTHVGDIHVAVNDTSRNPNLGTAIGNQIRRELRRGTIKF